MNKIKIAIIVVILGLAGWLIWRGQQPTPKRAVLATTSNNPKPVDGKTQTKAATNHCSSNTLEKLILVDTSQRHLWACGGSHQVYDSAVVTGYDKLAETITPSGTYKIYAKVTNTTLTGSDSNGSWNRPVYYWMPFLSNQYGVYGFHDATWRSTNAFGNISPDSSDASHGCVELSLAAAKWLYDWAPVGTTLQIN